MSGSEKECSNLNSEREWRTLLEAASFIPTGVYPVGGDNPMVRNVGIFDAKSV
jgi:hypothetical protein